MTPESHPDSPLLDLQADPSPKFQLRRLHDYVSNDQVGHPGAERSASWMKTLVYLSETFLVSFPLCHDLPWNTVEDARMSADETLDVIHGVIPRLKSLTFAVGGDEHVKKLFVLLTNFCHRLEQWIDVATTADDHATPLILQKRAFQATVAALRRLENKWDTADSSWKTLRAILCECIDICNDIVSLSPAIQYPLKITPFTVSRTSEIQEGEESSSQDICIMSADWSPIFLCELLDILTFALYPSVSVHSFFADMALRVAETASKIFDYCFSSSCSTSFGRRTRTLAHVVISAVSLRSLSPGFGDVMGNLQYRLLLYRLEDGPKMGLDSVDAALDMTFKLPPTLPLVKRNIETILDILRAETWGDTGDGLRELATAYLRPYISHADLEILRGMQAIFPERDDVMLIEQQIATLESALVQREEKLTWRAAVKNIVQKIITPNEVAWMDDDSTLADEDFIQRALGDVKSRFSRPLHASSAEAKLLLAENLAQLPCMIAHFTSTKCDPRLQQRQALDISSYIPAVSLLLSENEGGTTIFVRRVVFIALSNLIKHSTLSKDDSDLLRITEIVQHALTDVDRGVRLASGYVLAELVRMYEYSGGRSFQRASPLFANIDRLLKSAKDTVQETVLLTLGTMGKGTHAETLGHIVCCLIGQLGSQNPVLKGTALMQLRSIAKYHRLSAHALIHPYMARVAPFLVSRMCTQPNLLTESCRFLATNPADFVSYTLPRTLPQLFADGDLQVLEKISRELSKKPSRLFFELPHKILAHAFLLVDQGRTGRALTFIAKILTDAADNGSISIETIVKSHIVPLLAELVIVMGHEDPDKVATAKEALLKVAFVLHPPKKGRNEPESQDLGVFVKLYMLGVISDMNEMLQDIQGKKSIDYKQQIIRSLGELITHIGPAISNVAPQIMATMQTMLTIPQLSEVTLACWETFLTTLAPADIGPHVGPTSASFVSSWRTFTKTAKKSARKSLDRIISVMSRRREKYLDDIVDLSGIPELRQFQERLKDLRNGYSPNENIVRILERSSSDNLAVAIQSLHELKTLMHSEHNKLIREMASGDNFDPLVGQILAALLAAACRDGDGEGFESLRLLSFECIGILGALDPDRCEIGFNDSSMIVLSNFTDEAESVNFALHLIRDVLVGAFRSTSDISYQSHLAYTIQELLRFCKFTPALVAAGSGTSAPLKVRNRWSSLPKHVLETVTPLLESRYTLGRQSLPNLQHPIYTSQSTYREWIQLWAVHLVTKASGNTARTIFGVFSSAVRNKDVGVAHHLLPHLVLNVLISGEEDSGQQIRAELMAVLEDQLDPDSVSTDDKKLLSAQVVFMLFDHLNKWIRMVRQDVRVKKVDKKNRVYSLAEEQLLRVDSILSSIDQKLMAQAALKCRAYARSLMNFEKQIVLLKAASPSSGTLPEYYEHLHEIYANLDEPDGMEGVSTLILSPSLEHQIRQHESTGKWTSAQSCWEVRLQQAPDNLDFHLGLLRCLKNLGHYDTLRTHAKGVLTRNPGWQSALAGFQVESAWMVGAWDDVQSLVEDSDAHTSPIVMARLLLAMRTDDVDAISNSLSAARHVLGAPIIASGEKGYRRAYNAVLNLHLTHELELIHNTMTDLYASSQSVTRNRRKDVLYKLSGVLASRLDSTLPNFRIREAALSMQRTAFSLSSESKSGLTGTIGRSWLASAKIARKAGQWQTAYSAVLQAQQSKARFSFMESAKLVKANGEPLRALKELENSMHLFGLIESNDVIDLTEDDDETKKMKAKSQVLRARWMNESDRYDFSHVLKAFNVATDIWPKWESGQYHLGKFHDECFKNLSQEDQKNRGTRMNLYTVKSFAKAIRFGSKYVYQTIPRLLTLWLDMGEDKKLSTTEIFKKLNMIVSEATQNTPVYKWYTAFPQIVSRVGHNNADVYGVLSKLILTVIQEYPKQALWLFTSVVKSTKQHRGKRGKSLLDLLRSSPANAKTDVPMLINHSLAMTNELLALCDYAIDDDHRKTLSMKKDFPRLCSLGHSPLIIPLQESLTASLPPTSSSASSHQPFSASAPTFEEFFDEIDIMRSLAKPRKITIRGSNGQTYMFLGKPKDDLRKDARLMDFNAIINKLLKANSESRRRQLHIRTYGVVTLNEECGFIQWVPNTIPIRPVLIKGYDVRGIKSWSSEMAEVFKRIKETTDKEGGQYFVEKILPLYPPVFHEWFLETFPEPSAWLASRMAYGRTAAVMSMVGFILGLGDRHCENILLDSNTGDVVHVDFNCLFEKGKTLETPERVPFRLTQNIIDGLGVTGVEGVFRIACEVTLQLLRDNKDSLMSVLDAFIHDPLVEWEDEKRKLEREPSRRSNANNVKASVDLRMLAKNALSPIEKKLKGVYSTGREKHEREISTSNLVQILIQEATDPANLGKMYPGWAAWH